jgi:hypothetical protein
VTSFRPGVLYTVSRTIRLRMINLHVIGNGPVLDLPSDAISSESDTLGQAIPS